MGKKTKEQKYREAVERNIESSRGWLSNNVKSIDMLLRSRLGIRPEDTQFDKKIMEIVGD